MLRSVGMGISSNVFHGENIADSPTMRVECR